MWGLSDPEFEDENKLQGGKKVMCWGALMNGKVILHWFDIEENINPEVYLNCPLAESQVCGHQAEAVVSVRCGYKPYHCYEQRVAVCCQVW